MLGKLLDAISGGRHRGVQAPAPEPDRAPEPRPPEPEPPVLPFEIRPSEPGDRARLPALFRASIQGLAHRDHDPEQLRDWAAEADADTFAAELDQGVTVVALEFGRPVAFAQLAPLDYLNMLYVHPDSAGEGIATLLFQYLEDEARIAGAQTIRTHASPTARRFLIGSGFEEVAAETVQYGRSELQRVRMEKRLRN